MFGYWNKLLRINMTDKTSSVEEIADKDLRQLFGGAALGAKILLEEVPPLVDPLSEQNKLIFGLGFMQAANFPGNAKWSVITKSPLTGTFLDSAGTGAWAQKLKQCGYDAIVIEGKAASPVYLFINDDGCEFRDASQIWGKDTHETSVLIAQELGIKRVNSINIGRAGEELSPIACITCDGHSFAGRGGAGAVMGSKNLKAISAWGTKQVPLYDEAGAKKLAKDLIKRMAKVAHGGVGTSGALAFCEARGDSPVQYWANDRFPRGAQILSAPRYTEVLHATPKPCQNCPVGCHRHVKFTLKDGREVDTVGPEYETLGMLGSGLCIEDLLEIAEVNYKMNMYGVDTISCGSFVGFIIQCYENGILDEDKIGMIPRWNDNKTLDFLSEKIMKQEGIGAYFKHGIRGAAEIIGNDAMDFTVECKNLDYPAHDPRATYAVGVNYATSPRGACHTRGNVHAAPFGLCYPELHHEIPDPYDEEKAGYCAYIYQTIPLMFNNITICMFMHSDAGLTLTDLCDIYKVVTGEDMTSEELFNNGCRSIDIERLINVRDGLSRKDDYVSKRMYQPAITGPRKGKSLKNFDKMLDDYYELRQWTQDGIPTEKALTDLGLEEYIKYIPKKEK